MTYSRHVGQLSRRSALRKRQQAFLRDLVEWSGSRIRAVEASGTPLGTVLRWQASDPWFTTRYEEIRETLCGDAQALRDSLEAKALALALGGREGLLRPAAVRRLVDALDAKPPARRAKVSEEPGPLLSIEDYDAQIREMRRR